MGKSFVCLLGVLALIASFAACGDNAASPGAGGPSDGGVKADAGNGVKGLPCAVDEVLARRCQSCHSNPAQFGAPMPLVTYDDLHAPAPSDASQKVFQLVGARIHDDARPMPQAPNPRLGAVDTKVLDEYIGLGAPRSSTSCITRDAGTVEPLDCTPDHEMRPSKRWTMPKDQADEYVCYGINIETSSKRHVTAIAPKIDNTKLVHHVVLFQSDRAEYPTPTPCFSGGSLGWRMIYAWAPGGQNMVLPPEAGFALEGTTHYVAQIHYNNVSRLEGETDGSGVDLCTTDQLRPNDADVMAFGSQGFRIPKQSRKDMTCSWTIPSSDPVVHAFAAMPHMHKLGTAMVNTQFPAADPGKPVDLGTQSTWDFNNQVWMRVDATLRPGDVVKTRCAWTNPTQSDVVFGENTGNEMCYAFTMYYPRITASSWWQPASGSTCTDTK